VTIIISKSTVSSATLNRYPLVGCSMTGNPLPRTTPLRVGPSPAIARVTLAPCSTPTPLTPRHSNPACLPFAPCTLDVCVFFRNGALVVFVAAASPPARAPVETWPANGSAAAKAWPTPAALAGLEGPALPLPARAADLLVKPPDSEAPPSAGAGAASGGVDALLHALLTREVGARTSSVSGGGKRFRFRFPTREALPASLSLSLSLCTPPNHDHE
jgi:hypothetical protein